MVKVAIQNPGELTGFLKPWCATPGAEGEPVHYARLRAGKAKKSSDTIWRRDLPGEDPAALAREILDRHARLGKGEKGWLEVVEKVRGFPVRDTLPLGSSDGDGAHEGNSGDGPDLTDLDSASPSAMVAIVVSALVQTNQQLSSQLLHKDDRFQDLLLKHIEASAIGAADKAVLDWIRDNGMPGEGDDYASALRELAPMIPQVLEALSGGKKAPPKPPAEGETETPDARCDRLLTDMEGLWSEHPEALLDSPARLVRLQALGNQIGEAWNARQRGGGK